MTDLQNLFAQYGVVAWAASTIILLLYIIVLNVQVRRATRSYRKLLHGLNRGNLEELLDKHLNTVYMTADAITDLRMAQGRLEQTLQDAVQHVALVRFQAFEDTGGNQSFSLAMLDDNQNGFVLTSMYGRNAHRFYAKPIEHGKCTYALTEEESQAIQDAMGAEARVQTGRVVKR